MNYFNLNLSKSLLKIFTMPQHLLALLVLLVKLKTLLSKDIIQIQIKKEDQGLKGSIKVIIQ